MRRPTQQQFVVAVGETRLEQLRRFAAAEQMTVAALVQRVFDNGFERLVPSESKPFNLLPKTVNPTDWDRERRALRPTRA